MKSSLGKPGTGPAIFIHLSPRSTYKWPDHLTGSDLPSGSRSSREEMHDGANANWKSLTSRLSHFPCSLLLSDSSSFFLFAISFSDPTLFFLFPFPTFTLVYWFIFRLFRYPANYALSLVHCGACRRLRGSSHRLRVAGSNYFEPGMQSYAGQWVTFILIDHHYLERWRGEIPLSKYRLVEISD